MSKDPELLKRRREQLAKKLDESLETDRDKSMVGFVKDATDAGVRLEGREGELQQKHIREEGKKKRAQPEANLPDVFGREQVKRAMAIIQKRNSDLRRRTSTPRNLFSGSVEHWDAPKQVKARIVIWWFSDIMLQRRPALSGFDWSVWQPVSQKEIEEFGLEFASKNRDKNGTPRYGFDMSAWWTTREMYNEQKAVWKGMLHPSIENEDAREDLQGRLMPGTEVIGDVTETSEDHIPTAEELDSLAGSDQVTRERDEVGSFRE